MHSKNHLKPQLHQQVCIEVTPQSAGWEYLGFSTVQLKQGESFTFQREGREAAMVPFSGKVKVTTSQQEWMVQRDSVFTQKPHVLYLSPGDKLEVKALEACEFAIGSAPAEGRYPTRLFSPEEQKVEVRGSLPALREVHHTLAWPLPAERLILFEVYVPGGNWSGWPPHCHDRYMGSPYLEEVYYYKLNPTDGVAFHRNYRLDTEYDEILAAKDGDCILVREGFHPVAAVPGTQVYFLNYLAGELEDDARNYTPYEDPSTTWIKADWEANKLQLPISFDSMK